MKPQPIGIGRAAKEMGYCRQAALRRLKRMQKRHPDIEILIPRENNEEHWRINPIGLKRATELERNSHEADLTHRVGICESDLRTVHRKLRRLEICVFSKGNAEKSSDGAE